MISQRHQFGISSEAVVYPILLLIVLWLVYWADHLFPLTPFYKYGVMPQTLEGVKGIILMPLIHSKDEIEHIVNNSLPTAILVGSLIYFYREIALKIFVYSWLFTGIGLWALASNNNSYHIGMSGVIYAMAGFLFTSGVLRKYRPLQGISLFVAFVYGSMIWGVFPMKPHVSWEGHLAGLAVGVILAFIYRKRGPQPPKYQYEIEQELGIEPPDLEAEWNERVRQQEIRKELREQAQQSPYTIVYHYQPKDRQKDDTDQK